MAVIKRSPDMPMTGKVDPTPTSMVKRSSIIWYFILLKIRVLRNGIRGGKKRIISFALTVIGGVYLAGMLFLLLGFGSSSGSSNSRIGFVAITSSVITISWLLLPILFYGVDETIDPSRFALLPISHGNLVLGMFASACIGIPAVATMVGTLGLVVGGAIHAGVAGASIAVIAACLSLFVCVTGSRAITSSFASMLRSRKMRDFALIAIVILTSLCLPLQLGLQSLVNKGDYHSFVVIAKALSWTPLASANVAVLDVIDGRWLLACSRLAISLMTIGLFLRWWTMSMESAMVGSSSGVKSVKKYSEKNSAVDSLFPAIMRTVPATLFTAIIARDLRYYWRDPRWRASLVSLISLSIFLPIAMLITPDEGKAVPIPMVTMMMGVVIGMSIANIFGSDGPAFATQLLAGVPGILELRARVASLSFFAIPPITLMCIVVSILREEAHVLSSFGLSMAAFGSAASVSLFAAIFIPYPMPRSRNPFAVSSGGSVIRSLTVFIVMIAACGVTGPVIVLFLFVPSMLTWLVLPIGITWGLGAVLVSTYIAGDVLDRRGPTILEEITPRT